MKRKITLIATATLILNACSGPSQSKSSYRVYEKKASPAFIKIDNLDLSKNRLQLRFEYRSYIYDALDMLTCTINFNQQQSQLSIDFMQTIKLDAFSTEVLTFDDIKIMDKHHLLDQQHIQYELNCQLKYNKGRETVFHDSVLHLVPSSTAQYR